jgi:hypothetical protein
MNSIRIYNAIIENRKRKPPKDSYIEKHHILPHSLGGSNDKHNLVKLTAREHFICHLLLTEIYRNNKFAHAKMVKAFGMMVWAHGENQKRYVTSHTYQKLREKFSKAMSISQKGKNNSSYGTRWITNEIENRKINKEDIIPDGWRAGKVQLISRKSKYCKVCGILLKWNNNKVKLCIECKSTFIRKRNHVCKTISNKTIVCCETGIVYESVSIAAKELKLNQPSINRTSKNDTWINF